MCGKIIITANKEPIFMGKFKIFLIKVLKLMFSRVVIVAFFFFFQLYWFYAALLLVDSSTPFANIGFRIISFLAVVFVLSRDIKPEFKITWTIIILLFPVLGIGLYVLFGNKGHINRKIRREFLVVETTQHLLFHEGDKSILAYIDSEVKNELTYLYKKGYPTFKHTNTMYYSWGQDFYRSMLEELEKAKQYIFLEYFIIKPGLMWEGILKILSQKSKQGLDVRIIYDDWGCAFSFSKQYWKNLEAETGIKFVCFNRLKPIISVSANNRDHRKICVIDGNVGFSGGVNLGDEYINVEKRFGVWKDVAVKLDGEAVWALTIMFLQTWNAYKKRYDLDYTMYRPDEKYYMNIFSNDYVAPYGSSPLAKESLGENMYMKMINNAKDYIYITTPYLIIDESIINALMLAAKSGVDVRIITPGIYDKKIISWITKSNYYRLISSGVSIYEYTPGFIHAKSYVCDDKVCNVGTVNMDYRSFYHHFECSIFIYNSNTVHAVKNDILKTFGECKKFNLDDLRKPNIIKKFAVAVLRIFAPLM